MSSIISFMVLVQKFDVQLYAELFNYISGLMEWNLNTGNFPERFNQYVQSGRPQSHPDSLTMISPQSWYFWNTGKVEFWNHIESYMNAPPGQRPYYAPWTQYPPPNPSADYGRRNYIFVKQSMRQDLTPPSPIVDLAGSFNTGKSITLQWTSPASSVRYHVVWSDKPIVGTYSLSTTVSNWWAANALGVSKVATPGSKESLTVDIPYIKQPVYVTLFSFDEMDNMSKISNVAQVGVPLGPIAPIPPAPIKAPVISPQAPLFAPLPIALPVANTPVLSPTNTPPSGRIVNIYQGDNFELTVENALPGDTIIVHQGDYSVSGRISISVGGTASAPVLIRGAVGESRPRILRPSNAAVQNTINIEGCSYLTIQGLEILSNGGDGIKIAAGSGARNNQLITLDDLVIHQVAVGINSQTNVDKLVVRRSHIYDTSNTGEGLYLGCHDGSCIVTNSVIEGNWIHDTVSDQGDGIELKKNSYGNVIRNNVIYNTNYPGILVYGSGIGAVNIIEGNVMWNCKEGGIQVAADAIVRNNLVFNSGFGLISNVHNQVSPKNLKIVHNTFVKNQVCLNIRSWNGRSDIVFANNAMYCDTDTMDIQDGTQNVVLTGNVFYPNAAAFPSGSFVVGRGLSQDFESSTSLNAYPTVDSPLRSAANALYAVENDFDGTSRTNESPVDAGAYEWKALAGRKWAVTAGFKPFAIDNVSPTFPIAPPQIAPTISNPIQRPSSPPSPIAPPLRPISPPFPIAPPQITPTVINPIPRPIPSPPVPVPQSPLPISPTSITPIPRPPGRICFSGHNTVNILQRHDVTQQQSISSSSDRLNIDAVTSSSLLSDTNNSTCSHRHSTETILLSNLVVGDYVRTSNGKFTRVISFCHKNSEISSTFVQIHRSTPVLSAVANCDVTMKDILTSDDRMVNGTDSSRKTTTRTLMNSICVGSDVPTGQQPPALEISPDHLVYVIRDVSNANNRVNPILLLRNAVGSLISPSLSMKKSTTEGWIRAQEVMVGDFMVSTQQNCDGPIELPNHNSNNNNFQVVTDIRSIQRNGVYAPVTTTGTLTVSDTLVSSYVAVLGPPLVTPTDPTTASTEISLSLLISPHIQHYLAHTILSPVRIACYYSFATYCEKEVYDANGHPWYSRYILLFVDWYEQFGSNNCPATGTSISVVSLFWMLWLWAKTILKLIVLMVITSPLVFLTFVEHMFTTTAATLTKFPSCWFIIPVGYCGCLVYQTLRSTGIVRNHVN